MAAKLAALRQRIACRLTFEDRARHVIQQQVVLQIEQLNQPFLTTTVAGAPPPVIAPGGMYALGSNIGKYSSNVGAVLPEEGANLNWRLRSNMNLKMGYSLLYLGRVQRADDQIDSTVNPDLFPPAVPAATPRRPVFADNTSNIWIQTLNVGLDVTF